jgi:hypothetical protein
MPEPRKYAEGTDVSVERSRAELETLLHKHGATSVGILRDENGVLVVFEMKNRRIKQTITNPDPTAYRFTDKKMVRGPEQVRAAVESELKRRWRALVLIVKAKLELVASGGSTFEVEFLAHTMLPNGDTVGETMLPRIAQAYRTNSMPPLMLGPGPQER